MIMMKGERTLSSWAFGLWMIPQILKVYIHQLFDGNRSKEAARTNVATGCEVCSDGRIASQVEQVRRHLIVLQEAHRETRI